MIAEMEKMGMKNGEIMNEKNVSLESADRYVRSEEKHCRGQEWPHCVLLNFLHFIYSPVRPFLGANRDKHVAQNAVHIRSAGIPARESSGPILPE
jgi:hypothetical protein